MASERVRRRVDAALDEAEAALTARDWAVVLERAQFVLTLDPDNVDAVAMQSAANRGLGAPAPAAAEQSASLATLAQPESFVGGRYHVRRFLGEGGKKKVYLAHDQSLDRDVAFALIKTEGLDATGRERIVREAQAMGRLGAHPHVVTIFEIGEEGGPSTGSGQAAPYIVQELMGGGDVEGLIAKADGALPLARTLEIAKDVARGLVFAHEKSVVHRDLKPGNVWLTDAGVAKIGDFGLAVSLDRSRLTQHGMMVGTVSYMPPEQALGGETTPQADLYSLGAMLYEMVTGKPPFVGEDPTAVISQHINTPPVAPSWQSEHCPPDLEALILQLLAKVPAERPASAAAVLAALERVDPTAPTASHSDSSANPLDRLARGVFVGRERELERLRAAFDGAFAGRGSVVLLVGEPGIGKTRAAQELETYARMRGAQVLWGRANESSGAPPYFPWVQIARAYRALNSDELRRKEWGPYAVELQRIFPALRELFPDLPPLPEIESEEGQFRLFDAIAGFLHDVSTRVPLMLVLDDLHWADRPTLLLLTHLARELGHSRILVAGTYRDTDLDRTHPLSQTLAELNREQLFTRIPLRGLSREEVAAYIRATAHLEPASALVSRIYEETEGNPFFLSEVVNLMAQEGTLARVGSSSISDLAIPEGVKEALGRRLDRLSPETNSLLQLAAVAGREFDHALLVALTGHDDERVLTLVEEALAGRVIEETGRAGEYRFTHALMQETLAGELSAARQVRLHGQIAEVLERLAGANADAQAARLAQHYAESAVLNRAHAQQAARYSRLAAEHAAAQFAWDEAIRHYERCLAIVAEAPDRLAEDEAALWLGLALVQWPAGAQVGEAWRSFDRAIGCYRETADARGEARAWAATAQFGVTTDLRPRLAVLDAALSALDAGDSAERCALLAARAVGDIGPTGDPFAVEAEEMAARLGLSGAAYPWNVPRRTELVAFDRGHFDEAHEIGLQLHERMRTAGVSATWPLVLAFYAANLLGELGRAEQTQEAAFAHARRQRNRGAESGQHVAAALMAWRRGELIRYADALAQAVVSHFFVAILEAEVALAAGEPAAALRRCPASDPARGELLLLRTHGTRTRIHLALNDVAAARQEFDAWAASWRSDLLQTMLIRGRAIESLGDAACELADEAMRAEMLAFLDRYPLMRSLIDQPANPDDLRGRLALSLGRVDDAERHFRTGLEWASRPDVRYLVDAGRCHQGLAEIAELRGDHALAAQHLDDAGELFQQHGGAKLYLDQVIAKKQILRA